MYLAVAGVPFVSTRRTPIPAVLPVNVFSGVNSTIPLLIVYVPSPGTTTGSVVGVPVLGSINFVGTLVSNGTSTSVPLTVAFPVVNTGFPVCFAPWTSSVTASVAVGVAGLTVGVYLAVADVPFVSTRLTSIPFAVPVNVFSGVNVTFPFSSIVYVPSFGTVTDFSSVGCLVAGSTNLAGTLLSNGTTTSVSLTVAPPAVNTGVAS